MSLVTRGAIIGAAVLVFVVWKGDSEIRNKVSSPGRRPKRCAKTRKRKARRISRACFDVTIRTDARRRTFTRKELLPVTRDARLVLGKLGDIRKRVALLAHGFPVVRRKFMTGLAFELVILVDV